MEKMLVTQGLNELSLLNDRINKATREAKFVAAVQKSSDIVASSVTRENFKKNAVSELDSVFALIDRRKAIKSAIVKSNATTVVEINGKKYTVAEAIEFKSSIQYYRNLKSKISDQLDYATHYAERINETVETDITATAQKMAGRDGNSKMNGSDYESLAIAIRNQKCWEVIDPINASRAISDIDEIIDGFMSEVDTVLQVSNCRTFIEF